MFKVEIDRKQVNEVQHRKVGKDQNRDMYIQNIWLYKPGIKHPIEVALTLPEGIKFYPEGFYVMPFGDQLSAGQYSALSLTRYADFPLITISPEIFSNFDKLQNQFFDSVLKPVVAPNVAKLG